MSAISMPTRALRQLDLAAAPRHSPASATAPDVGASARSVSQASPEYSDDADLFRVVREEFDDVLRDLRAKPATP